MKLMGGKIKNLFFNLNRFNKPAVLAACPVAKRSLWFGAVFFLIFLGLASPLQLAQAGIVSGILGALASIPIAIITLLLQIVLLVTNLFVSIAGVILWWVLSPYFMSLPYTSGGIVDVGWPIVRDFINMFFIIALVIIGLATALRIKEYQVQKTLPTLIIIAILINFTPVICGLIVDASNIIMNFFLEELTGLRIMVTVFSTQGSLLVEMFSHPFDIRYATAALGKTLGLIAFGGIASFVFLLYSVLFIMRYIMIWVLVIVSPIAFFSRIFPATKRGEYVFKSILSWDEWWKQFIEWSLIGIAAGFFLYLGEQLMVMAPDFIPGVYPEGVGGMLATPMIDFMNNLLPYGVVLAFLLLGFFVATSTSAMGASAITSFFKEQGMAIGKAAMFPLQRLGVRGIAGAAGVLGRAGGLVGKGAGRLEKIPYVGKAFKPVGMMAKGFEAVGVAPLRRYAARARRLDFDEMFKGMEAGEMAEQTGTLLSKADRVAAAGWMAEKGFFDKVPGKSVPDIDPETGEQKIDPETGLPKTKVINPFHDQMAKEAADLAEKPEYRKSATDVLETLAGKVTEKVSLKLETDPTAKAKLKIEIGKIAEEISKDEKIKVEIEARAKEEGISFEQAARDMAARQIWTGVLKSGDVKDMAKSSFDDAGVRRGTEMWHSGQWQALMNNFKKPVVDKTLNEPGGLNYMIGKEGTAFLEQFADKNSRGFNFFARSPAGREWNFEGLKYMLDPEGRPTTRVADFERRRRIQGELKKEPVLDSFNKLHVQADQYRRRIEQLQKRGKPTAHWEGLLATTSAETTSAWEKIERNEPLRDKWFEIEKLRRPKEAPLVEREMGARLRAEGILKTEPTLAKFNLLHRKAEEWQQRVINARRRGKSTDYAEQRYASMAGMLTSEWEKIEQNDRLREKWEEIGRLRRPPKPPQRRGPESGGRPPRGGGPSPRGGGPSPRGGPGGGPAPGAGPTPTPAGGGPAGAEPKSEEEKGLTPEELAAEAVKEALEETRRERKRREGRGRKGR